MIKITMFQLDTVSLSAKPCFYELIGGRHYKPIKSYIWADKSNVIA